jgi:hypothetical protein
MDRGLPASLWQPLPALAADGMILLFAPSKKTMKTYGCDNIEHGGPSYHFEV